MSLAHNESTNPDWIWISKTSSKIMKWQFSSEVLCFVTTLQWPWFFGHFRFSKFIFGILYSLIVVDHDDVIKWKETFSALLAICAGNPSVPGEFPAQRPVTRSFGVFFDLRLNKRLSKQSRGWCFKTLPRPLWHHCNVLKEYRHNIR